MVAPRHLNVSDGDVILLVGTMKGLFLLRSNGNRADWDVGGPYFPGRSVYAAAYDGRAGRRRIWAGGLSEHWGPGISSSDDFGASWQSPESATLRFPDDAGDELKQVWQIRPGRESEPDTMYVGVDPAALFVSTDDGTTWELSRGLWDHPHREHWNPGYGGLCLHTILPDPRNPDRITVAVSAAGVYQTDDGGSTWHASNRGIRAEFLPDKYPEFGQCVHKIAHHPSRPHVMMLQNHWGLYRSDDGGELWHDVANGVPSDFGFAMAQHPHEPDTVFIVPIESDGFRCTPEGKLRVYRTRNGGESWEPLTNGLPQQNALETILRDGMDTDEIDPAGVYFGTRSGKVYASANGGEGWTVAIEGLPPVVCVKAAVVGSLDAVVFPRPAPRPAAKTAPAKRKAAKKKAAKKKKTKKAAKKKATKRTATKKKVAKKKTAKKKATKKKVARKKVTKRKATKKKVAKRKAAKKKATKRKTAKRKVAKKKATRKKATRKKATKRGGKKKRSRR